jgi:hypothetical protein
MYFLGLITRCKDEFFVKEFCDYYLSQGVDKIYIIDDNSHDKTIYNDINDNRVEVIYEKNLFIKDKDINQININTEMVVLNKYYKILKEYFEWFISVDVDEFITTRKNSKNTIRCELKSTFKDVDCIKIPWVMMACNSREKNPNSILLENIYRWDHNKKHPHKLIKFRCRYNEIEVKCIFKTNKFDKIDVHHPSGFEKNSVNVVDSINKKTQKITPFYDNLREEDIENGYLLCYHYRIISIENSSNKLKKAQYKRFKLEDLIASDHPEIIDETLKNKTINNNTINNNIKIFLIGFNRCGTRTLHYFFKDNNLKSIHWDSDNLVNVFENNIKNGNKLLENGKTINKKVNSDCNYSEATVFSDMTKDKTSKDAKDYYKQLDNDYPNSKFILNIRDVDKWIKSRIKHANGRILKYHMSLYDCDEEQVKIIWKQMYEKHIIDVKNYFKDRSLDLCIFNIENDSVDKIIEFLKDDFVLNKKYYNHVI